MFSYSYQTLSGDKEKVSLRELREKYSLTAQRVAEAAGVPLRIEYLMEIGGIIKREDAELVLDAIFRLTGVQCSIDIKDPEVYF